jgi:cytidylate kinase
MSPAQGSSVPSPWAITISRALGSGGAYIGQQLAERLGMIYLDDEILKEVARQRGVPEEMLVGREEAITPLWKAAIESFAALLPEVGAGLQALDIPTDKELFALEAELISRVGRDHSVVVIGRCGNWVLRHHPQQISIFLHAHESFRLPRIQARYKNSRAEAQRMLETTDRAREVFRKTMTGREATDATQYDLCLDTGILGVDGSLEVVLEYVRRRFGDPE